MPNTTIPELKERFRQAMSSVCTPVSVVTSTDSGSPHGTTVSAFASLSMEPPMVMVSLDRGSELLTLVRTTGSFGLNILASAQSDLALNFARKGGSSKFDNVSWTEDHGVPRLPDAVGFVACRVEQFVEGGDHIVLLGRVLGADSNAAPPLTYHGRVFGTHAPH